MNDTKEHKTSKDILTHVLDLQKANPENYSEWEVLMAAFANIAAGADTTYMSINAILYYLIKNPVCMSKLRQEIEAMSKGGAISDPIKFGETQKMPYLQAVIKEGQRMYPAAGLPLWRVVPEPGATLCGKFFPPGVSGDRSRQCRIVKKTDKHQTTVGVNSWVAHRNTAVFAPDPDVYRPERWLESSAEKRAAMDRYYIPVGPTVSLRTPDPLTDFSRAVWHGSPSLPGEEHSLDGDVQGHSTARSTLRL